MVTPNEENDEYVKDPRTACKYGNQCYQKSSEHLQKFKHPPKIRPCLNKERNLFYQSPKRPKFNNESTSNRPRKIEPSVCNPVDLDTKAVRRPEVLSDSDSEQNADEAPLLNTNGKRPVEVLSDSDTEQNSDESPLLDDTKEFDEPPGEPKASTSSSSHFRTPSVGIAQEQRTYVINNKTVNVQDEQLKPLTPTIINKEKFIKEKFLVIMPPDFYTFWDYCTTLKPDNPSEAFANIGIHLVGPYDVLAGKFSNVIEKTPNEYLTHWRYFYDPPEFQTIIKGPDATGYHIGYFRDEPSELPVFVGSNHAKKDGVITLMGENIFAALVKFLETSMKSCDPFKKMSLNRIYSQLKSHAANTKINLSDSTENIKTRTAKVLSSTFNKAGLVVPYNRKTQLGYRHLYISNKDLRKLLDRVANASEQQRTKVLSELQPVLTAASIATDECDFGTGLELGWNILAHGVDSLNTTIEQYLNTAYSLLNRGDFAKIASAHMANRRKGTNLSIL